jgi:hypothetical protein
MYSAHEQSSRALGEIRRRERPRALAEERLRWPPHAFIRTLMTERW